MTPDHPPEVRLLALLGDFMVMTKSGHALKIAFGEARDDFGLRRVEFFYALRPSGKPAVLTDKITGPILQIGKRRSRYPTFTWDFSKKWIRRSVETWNIGLRPSIANPTGRGVTESPHFQINLLMPTDFHNQILYEAKKVLAEARPIAYVMQKKAYWLGQS